MEGKTPAILNGKRHGKSRKTICWEDSGILWPWQRPESYGKEDDERLFELLQNMSKMMMAVIPINPIKKAKKFVVAR